MNTAIKVESLSKAYQLGQFSTGTLSRDLHRWWALVRGREDPFLKIGETNDRSKKGESDVVWSLRDINFEIEQGDAVGIIGRNGAGKSTLLKVLSQVTTPTTGNVKVRGRVASLLEVGTGFHPELTGRENIYLNGAILGMRKREIARKFDEIVDFSGVERYIDTPVKRYSSGMYVRLAFAVAAHLESEILIVDEVLAVGDAEFQKKCLGKMGEVRAGFGKTVLFVSHNMASVKQLCTTGILLEKGKVENLGEIGEVVKAYNDNSPFHKALSFTNECAGDTDILSIQLLNDEDTIYTESAFTVIIKFKLCHNYSGCAINFIISNSEQDLLMSFDTDVHPDRLQHKTPGNYLARISLPPFSLKPGKYRLSAGIGIVSGESICQHRNIIFFEVDSKSDKYSFMSYRTDRIGVVPAVLNWEIKKIQE